MEFVIHYFIENECEMDVNREAIQTENEFEKLINIINTICEETNSNYFKICPEGIEDFIIYDKKKW